MTNPPRRRVAPSDSAAGGSSRVRNLRTTASEIWPRTATFGRGVVARLLPAGLAAGALGIFGFWQRDPQQRPETFFLTATVGLVLGCVGLSSADRRISARLLGAGLACGLAGWTLHYGPHRGGTIGLVLTLSLALAALDLWERPPSFGRCFAWIVGLQCLTHGELLLGLRSGLPGSLHPLAILLGVPLLGAAILYCLAGSPILRPLATLMDRPPVRWTLALVFVAVTLPTTYPWLRPDPFAALVDAARAEPTLFAVAAAAILAGPWLVHRRRAFVVALTVAVVALASAAPPSSLVLVDRRTEILKHGQFRLERLLYPEPGGERLVREVVLETDLVHGADLPPGTEVFRVFLDARGKRIVNLPVHAGTETGDWASGRPGMSRPAVDPWARRVAGDGTFFRWTFRTVIRLDEPVSARRLILRRMDDLPKDVVIRVHRLEVRP